MRVGLSLLFDNEVVVEGVHQLDVDFLLVKDKALPLRLWQLLDGLEVVILLVGDEPSYDRDVVAVDAVVYLLERYWCSTGRRLVRSC